MSSHTLEGKKKTQNGVKRLVFTVLSILLEVVFLVGIFKGLNEYAVVHRQSDQNICRHTGSENIWKK